MLGSNLARSLVRDMVSVASDIEIVGELDDEPGAELKLLEEADRTRPDFVIVVLREPAVADLHLQLLERWPRMKVLEVAGSERDAHLWKLQLEHELNGQLSPERLRQAIHEPDWRHARVT